MKKAKSILAKLVFATAITILAGIAGRFDYEAATYKATEPSYQTAKVVRIMPYAEYEVKLADGNLYRFYADDTYKLCDQIEVLIVDGKLIDCK